MLTPEYLEQLPDEVRALYAAAEQEIINDIARRISQDGYLSPTGLWQYQRLSEIRWIENDIIQRLSEITGRAQSQIRADFEDAMRRSLAHEDAIHTQGGVSLPPLENSTATMQIIDAGLATTMGLFQNLTSTTANTGGKQLERILDVAYQKIASGAFTYDQAVRSAVKQLSANGIASVTYASGHIDYIDTVVRRSLLTGVNQTAGQVNMQRCQDAGCDLVEVSAHGGARVGIGIANHASWQGKIYSISGTHPQYPHFTSATGYGQGAGLCGWNCRHNYSAFYEGISERAYPDELLDEYTAENIPYNGQNIRLEEAERIQRYNERQIRRWKREADGLDAAGINNSFERSKVREWQARQRDFIEQTGLRRDYTRERAGAQYLNVASKSDIINYTSSNRFRRANADNPKVSPLSDSTLPHTADVSFGAVNGVVPQGAQTTNVRIIAGSGTSTPLRDTPRLDATYGGNPTGWQKITGTVLGTYYRYEVHWYQNGKNTYPDEIKTIRMWDL